MKISGIYGIKNKISNKWYVGSSQDIEARWKVHIKQLKTMKHNNPKLSRAWAKYDEDSWEWIILEKITDLKDLVSQEQKWIDDLNSYNNGYNAIPIAGRGFYGVERTPEEKAIISAKCVATRKANNSYKHTEETKKKISEKQRGIKKGPMSEEQKKLIAKRRKETMTEEEKKACGDRARGRVYTREQLKNFSESHKGYKAPESQKKAISRALKGKPKSKEHIRNMLLTRKKNGIRKVSKKACEKYDIPYEE